MFIKTKPHHIALSVKDIEQSKRFYFLLGFRTVFEYISETKDLQIAHLMLNSIILELFCYANNVQNPPKMLEEDLRITGIKHFGLSVDSIEQARDEVIKAGLSKEQPEIKKGRTGISYFFIRDPDDNFVEIVQDNRVFTLS
jgi:glyoxylase I family protein